MTPAVYRRSFSRIFSFSPPAPKTSPTRLCAATLSIVCLLVLQCTSACLRYVPSRSELAKQDSSAALGTGEEFRNHQDQMRSVLHELSQKRSALLTTQSESAYELGVGDVVEISVFGLPELSTTASLSPDGTLTLPLIDPVPAVGMTVEDLRGEVANRFRRFVRSPQVRVAVREYQAHRVSVVGEVAKPGMYALKRPGMLVTEVLSEAGGRTEKAAERLILLAASSSAEQITGDAPAGIEIHIEELIGGIDRHPIVLPLVSGDTIIIPPAGTFTIDGEVEKPGSYPVSPGLSTLGAVAAGGGFTYSANVREVEVIRDIGRGRKAALTLDLEQIALEGGTDVCLQSGDLVRVPSEDSRFRRRQLVEVLNGFFKVGVNPRVQ